jgi:hypothetical protein
MEDLTKEYRKASSRDPLSQEARELYIGNERMMIPEDVVESMVSKRKIYDVRDVPDIIQNYDTLSERVPYSDGEKAGQDNGPDIQGPQRLGIQRGRAIRRLPEEL